jgi:signal transduction histidine kinase
MRWTNQLSQSPLVNLAHEIRTPLTAIKGYTTTLMQPDLTWTPEEQQGFLHTINQEVDRLNEAFGNLLGLTSEGFTLLEDAAVNILLADLLAPLVEEIGQALSHRKIEFTLGSGLPPVKIDPPKTRRVILQLAHCLDSVLPAGTPLKIAAY